MAPTTKMLQVCASCETVLGEHLEVVCTTCGSHEDCADLSDKQIAEGLRDWTASNFHGALQGDERRRNLLERVADAIESGRSVSRL